MNEVSFLILGLIIGGLIAWFWAKSQTKSALTNQLTEIEVKARGAENTITELRNQLQERIEEIRKLSEQLKSEQTAKVTAETRLEESQKNLEEQKRLLDEAAQKLKDTFTALSSEALKSNNQAFLELARKTMENYISEAKGDLGKRQEAIDLMIKPLKETLQKYESQIRELESSRQGAYSGLKVYLDELKITQEKLQKETTTLVSALKTPQVRGRWGEITLKRVVEVAGMSKYCDFEEQPSVDTEEGRKRPDLIVKLPGERTVIVDAKVPFSAYMEASETVDDEKRKVLLLQHAQAVRTHMRDLSSKAYWNQFNPTPDFVVLFLPGESFFSMALEQDRSLIEDGIASRVILATPTTLIALLRTVAYSWQQQQVAENSKLIWETGVELFNRVCKFAEYIGDIGKGLSTAVKSYNSAIGSWESRVIPGGQRLKELGASAPEKDVPELNQIDTAVRELPPSKEKKE
ncbi:MAG: recombinase RmuC [Nitrospinae bacterium RIFCSPLOWO2_02_FULL_39_110]|nr:MAG: recombinase RmuC [Nitrospinae bacterium RIFCSPHIGHO2_02_39_11]OGW03562.1 MAG: recombinase RmuC [Nitrospinae bacterium RIFCSPLOWO2_02_FULL_39_110]OGW03956.1 MAG: recombinase RmuC [Nitrospinae bacterium RIFCSPLOWO2_02_39_17]OGW11467.1 MAG: recombinase RmuC [Nitrospinae bacterium RIFCSPLOWO2_12_39_15]